MCLFIKVPCKYFIHWCAETKIKLWTRSHDLKRIFRLNAQCKFNESFPPYNVATVFSCLDVWALFFTNVTNCILLNVCHLKIIFTLNWTSILNIKFKYLSFYLRNTQLYEELHEHISLKQLVVQGGLPTKPGYPRWSTRSIRWKPI